MNRLRPLLFSLLLLLPPGLFASEAYDYESITVAGTAIGLTSSKLAPSSSGLPTRVYISVETASVRFRMDGTDPTSTEGHILNAGDSRTISGFINLKRLKFIRTSASAVVKVTYERGPHED